VELGALTDGERAGLLVAATWVALGLERSLVLVDQAELHIHPEQQPAFFEGLASLLRRGQLVVSTTSPAILRNPSGAKVLVLPA
jgi:predicted ATP-dependent endonuclease of OLD family